jgi:transposase
MMMAHAIQIRTRAVELTKEGYTQEAVAKILKVGTTSIKRWGREIAEYGAIRCNYDTSSRVASKLPASELCDYFESNNDALLKEAIPHFNCTAQAVFYACERNKITYKKEPRYKERKESDRKHFNQKIADLDANVVIYVDEVRIDKHYHRDHGRALRGVKIYAD